jgi:hypothetical protein
MSGKLNPKPLFLATSVCFATSLRTMYMENSRMVNPFQIEFYQSSFWGNCKANGLVYHTFYSS